MCPTLAFRAQGSGSAVSGEVAVTQNTDYGCAAVRLGRRWTFIAYKCIYIQGGGVTDISAFILAKVLSSNAAYFSCSTLHGLAANRRSQQPWGC